VDDESGDDDSGDGCCDLWCSHNTDDASPKLLPSTDFALLHFADSTLAASLSSVRSLCCCCCQCASFPTDPNALLSADRTIEPHTLCGKFRWV